MKKPALLLIVEYFLPGYKSGGPVRSVVNLLPLLGQWFEVFVLTRDRDYGATEPYADAPADQWLVRDGYRVYYVSPSRQTPATVLRLVRETSATFVYANSLFGKLTLLMLAVRPWLRRVRVIITPRGELHPGALRIKPWKKRPFLALIRLGIGRGLRWHATDAAEVTHIQHQFPGADIRLAAVLPNVAPVPPRAYQKQTGRLRLIFLSRIAPKKGLDFLLDALQQPLPNAPGDVSLAIFGPTEDVDYWQHCQARIATLPPGCTATYHGPLLPEQLGATLPQYDFFVLPTQGENFGHVIFEALAHGLPVLISDQTPWRGLTEQRAGFDVALQSDRWRQTLAECLRIDNATYQTLVAGARQAADAYLYQQDFAAQYQALFTLSETLSPAFSSLPPSF